MSDTDLVLDTGPLAAALKQYFQAKDRLRPEFQACKDLSHRVVRQINRIVEGNSPYIIAASALAFVELAYNWRDLAEGYYQHYQLASFLQQPPEWFAVEPLDENIIPYFVQVPPDVKMQDGQIESIEWTDAVHLATAMSRQEGKLVTTDRKLLQIAPEFTLGPKNN